jgi:hypothetical protein
MNSLLTITDIEREIRADFPCVRRHHLTYALREYRIEPSQRAGIIRLWHRNQLDAIRGALVRIADRREATHAR